MNAKNKRQKTKNNNSPSRFPQGLLNTKYKTTNLKQNSKNKTSEMNKHSSSTFSFFLPFRSADRERNHWINTRLRPCHTSGG
jgi:hypothetical protein